MMMALLTRMSAVVAVVPLAAALSRGDDENSSRYIFFSDVCKSFTFSFTPDIGHNLLFDLGRVV